MANNKKVEIYTRNTTFDNVPLNLNGVNTASIVDTIDQEVYQYMKKIGVTEYNINEATLHTDNETGETYIRVQRNTTKDEKENWDNIHF